MKRFSLYCVVSLLCACGSDNGSNSSDANGTGTATRGGQGHATQIDLLPALADWQIEGAAFYEKACLGNPDETVTKLILTPYPINCEGSLGSLDDHTTDHVVAVIQLGNQCGNQGLNLNTNTFTDNGDGTETISGTSDAYDIDITAMPDPDANPQEASFRILGLAGADESDEATDGINTVKAPHCGQAISLDWTLGPGF